MAFVRYFRFPHSGLQCNGRMNGMVRNDVPQQKRPGGVEKVGRVTPGSRAAFRCFRRQPGATVVSSLRDFSLRYRAVYMRTGLLLLRRLT
jgi:hypothetical protein